jgi:hypothetical protein
MTRRYPSASHHRTLCSNIPPKLVSESLLPHTVVPDINRTSRQLKLKVFNPNIIPLSLVMVCKALIDRTRVVVYFVLFAELGMEWMTPVK